MVEKLRLSVKNAAEVLDITPKALYHRVSEGRIVPVRDGRKVFFTLEEIERYARGEVMTVQDEERVTA